MRDDLILWCDPGMTNPMSVRKLTVSIDESLIADATRAAKAETGGNLSAYIADALQTKLRLRLMSEAIAQYEAEHGELSAAEVAAARRKLVDAGVVD
jgi:Arc/MetJ family transcription regulator